MASWTLCAIAFWATLAAPDLSSDAAHASPPLSLESAVDLAMERNERTRLAEQDVEVAQAQLDQARAWFFPQATLAGTYTRRLYPTVRPVDGQNRVLMSENGLNGALGVNLVLLDVQAIPLYQSASRSVQATSLGAMEQRRQLAFDAAQAFLLVLTSEQVRDAAHGRVAFAQQTLADTRARFSAQLVGTNDVTRAELELAVARAVLANTDGVAQSNYLQLAFLLAMPVEPPLASPQALFDQAQHAQLRPTEELLRAAIQRRPDLRALERGIDAARVKSLSPPLRLVPSVTARAEARGTNEPGLFGRHLDGSAMITLTWPLYDGGFRAADERRLDAFAEAASLQTLALSRQVATDLEKAITMLGATQRALGQSQAAATRLPATPRRPPPCIARGWPMHWRWKMPARGCTTPTWPWRASARGCCRPISLYAAPWGWTPSAGSHYETHRLGRLGCRHRLPNRQVAKRYSAPCPGVSGAGGPRHRAKSRVCPHGRGLGGGL